MEKRITGHTELLGLIATPIRHSKSPVMHNAACRALGLDPLPTALGDLGLDYAY